MEDDKDEKPVTMWVIKYALSVGQPEARQGELVRSDHGATYFSTGRITDGDRLFVRVGTEAFETEAEAWLAMQTKVVKKLKSLDKQYRKLEALRDKVAARVGG